MSFDVFLQAFRDGDAATADAAAIGAAFAAYIDVRQGSFARLVTGDGGADCYGLGEDSLMVNHASGQVIWDVVVEAARVGGLTIMPTGCPVCIVDPSVRSGLPTELQRDVREIRSGADLLAVIRSSGVVAPRAPRWATLWQNDSGAR